MLDARRQLEAMGVPMISGGSEEGTAKRHPSTLVGIDRNTFDETVAEITVICNQDDDFTTEEEVGEALGHALASKLHEMMSDVDYHFFHHKRIFSIEEEILERRRVAKKS